MQVRSSVMPPSVTVGDGQIFACQGDIFALDAQDGALRHRYALRNALHVTAATGRLYVITHSLTANRRQGHTVRALRVDDVQIDVVPRLFDAVGPNSSVHRLEGLPLLTVAPVRISPRTLSFSSSYGSCHCV